MNWIGISIFVNLLIFSIIFFQPTLSASFPNPPQKPPLDASSSQRALFWKLLRNYYAIMTRPRFGKRFDSSITHSSFIPISDRRSSEYSTDHILHNKILNANNQPIDVDNFYAVEYPHRRRRRQQQQK